MKSIPKLIRRFLGVFLLSAVALVLLNLTAFVALMAHHVPDQEDSPYRMAKETGESLTRSVDGAYALPVTMEDRLTDAGAWAIFIDQETLRVQWKTKNVPAAIPSRYALSDIADLSLGYLDGYPTYIGRQENGVVVVGFPRDSFWKHTQPSWNYTLIAHAPQIALSVVCINILCILGIYFIANLKLLRSASPITAGIQALAGAERVHLPEVGVLSEISAQINAASDILQQQKEALRKKETARANWIAGVSHDIRTPLAMVMGYAGQLETSRNLPEGERKKATIILKQSARMKHLIDDLNLASKLEYNMQPLMAKDENMVAVVREVVVDYMNMDLRDPFAIQWETDDLFTACPVRVDKKLLKRAIYNLIQNSIKHNENGCTIYVSVSQEEKHCVIRVEDDGVGISQEKLERFNRAPHYMLCDTSTAEQRHGLGLLIVEQILDAHHGTVALEKSKHGGLMVTLRIPRTER